MKTAPFDLELAKLGHPLVTREGRKVIDFHCINIVMSEYPLRCLLKGDISSTRSYMIDGRYDTNTIMCSLDLLLDLETPWERPLQPGDFIAYEDNGANIAIFVGYHNGKVVASPVRSGIYKVITVWQLIDPYAATKTISKLYE